MKKIGIFYGSTTGTTKEVAYEIARQLDVKTDDVYDVAKTAPSAVGAYVVLFIGASTWRSGDLEDDMIGFIDGLQSVDLDGKEVAIFGCGDDSMVDTFCDSVGEIYHSLHDTKAMFIAPFNNDGYDYSHSESDVHGMTVGLCIDNVNHADQTDKRVKAWCDKIKEEIC